MRRYAISIKRLSYYLEDVDAIIVAKSKKEADSIAENIGNGKAPNWPQIERYNTAERGSLMHEFVELTHGEVPSEGKKVA